MPARLPTRRSSRARTRRHRLQRPEVAVPAGVVTRDTIAVTAAGEPERREQPAPELPSEVRPCQPAELLGIPGGGGAEVDDATARVVVDVLVAGMDPAAAPSQAAAEGAKRASPANSTR